MDKEKAVDYTRRVTQASQSELIVIMFDVIMSDIEEARVYYDAENYYEYSRSIKHAERFVQELMSALNYTYSISYALMSLYMFVHKTLIAADMGRRPEKLDDAVRVLEKLRSGFCQVSTEDKSGPVMQNTQQVYAGMTYGRGVLNETFVDARDYNRGFSA